LVTHAIDRFGEGSALGLFIFLVLLWFFRAPGFIQGWDSGFRPGFISDATPAILIAFVLFLWPKKAPGFKDIDSDGKPPPYEPILTWQVVSRKFPWDVVLLLGGALALAEGVQVNITRNFAIFRTSLLSVLIHKTPERDE
jgi:solute carrier family 13 (sodium-dependent dicarboxylate transporter), member 2/3/5